MSILASKIVDRCNSFLDAEGSDRYTFERDYIFAINSSIEWITGVINSVYSINKFPAEYLRDLTKIKVFRTSDLSRVFVDVPNEEVWNINAVYPKAQFRAIDSGISATATQGEDVVVNGGFDTDLSGWTNSTPINIIWNNGVASFSTDNGYLSQNILEIGQTYNIQFYASNCNVGDAGSGRVYTGDNFEQFFGYGAESNPDVLVDVTLVATSETFSITCGGDGFSFDINDVVVRRIIPTTETALYYNAEFTGSDKFAKRKTVEEWGKRNRSILTSGSNKNTFEEFVSYAYLDHQIYNGNTEIEIAPSIPNEAVGISYLKRPTAISSLSDNLEFPTVLTDLFVKKTLNNIAIKIGDQNLSTTMNNEVNNILKQLF